MNIPFDWKVIDMTEALSDGTFDDMWPEDIERVAIHRTIDNGTASELCKRFHRGGDLSAYTGNENPYHFIIEPDGTCVQAIELDERGAHARRWNKSAVGVAIMQDMRTRSPTTDQRESLEAIASMLCLWVGGVDGVLCGHDELDGGSKSPNKQCPGEMLDMDDLRLCVEKNIAQDARLHDTVQLERFMMSKGVVF